MNKKKKIKGVREQRRGEAKYCKKQIQKQGFKPENKTNVKRNKGTWDEMPIENQVKKNLMKEGNEIKDVKR